MVVAQISTDSTRGTRLSLSRPSLHHPSCYEARLAEDEIRVLRILPGKYGEPISTELITQKLDCQEGNSRFQALSYTWGARSESHTISVNGISDFAVTDNAYSALQRLRYHSIPRMIWIDAICINQEDIPERNAQVAFMGTIYRSADQVVIWLGDADESVVTLLHRTLSKFKFDIWFSDFEEHCLAMATYNTKPHWWDRIWVVQEFACAVKAPVILFGRCEIPWHSLRTKARTHFLLDLHHEQATIRIHPRTLLGLFRDGIARLFNSIGSILEVKHSDEGRVALEEALYDLYSRLEAFETYRCELGTTCLVDIAWALRDLQSTNPRDKIYGMLSMVHAESRMILNPDYELPVIQVFSLATVASLKETGSQDFRAWKLITFGDERPKVAPWNTTTNTGTQLRTAGLPTWAVDFAFPGALGHRNDTWCRYGFLEAGTLSPCVSTLRLSDDIRRLTLRCFLLTNVEHTTLLALQGESFRTYPGVEELLAYPIDRDPYTAVMGHNSGPLSCQDSAQTPKLYIDTEKFGKTTIITNDEALARAFELWHQQIWPTKAADPTFQYFATYEANKLTGGLTGKKEIPSWVGTSCNPRNYSKVIHYFDEEAKFTSGGSAMFTTPEGFLGCANRYVLPGDRIAMLDDSPRFVVLRPQNGVYEFMGFAYLHGFMRGELEELRALGHEWHHLAKEVTLV